MTTTIDLYEAIFEEYPKMLTVEEMCDILNVARETGYRMVRRGEFEVLKLGRIIRIPKNQVLKYIIDNLEKK
ncbi:MAG: helix-turn-helix domain-containing protein [Clostridia bacterium]|nr:helix-turn-helix domain-containing protein [Clostridia bacterium]